MDMRYVCPEDVKKMLLKQARTIHGRSGQPTRETKEEWTDKHRNEARKLILEAGFWKERLFDIGWLDENKCEGCHKEEGSERHRLYHCPSWNEVRRRIPEAFRKWEQKGRISKKEWKWQRGMATHPLSESQWNMSHFSVKR